MKNGAYLNSKNLQAALILYLILFSAAMPAANAIQQATSGRNSKSSSSVITPFYKGVCTKNPLRASNKPPIFMDVISFPNFAPASCRDPASDLCKQETESITTWKKQAQMIQEDPQVDIYREQIQQTYNVWQNEVSQSYQLIVQQNNIVATSEQAELFMKAVTIIAQKKIMLLKNAVANEKGFGRCGESKEVALAKIFYRKLFDKNDRVRVYNVIIKFGKSDHNYLLLSEEGVPEVNISDKPSGVAKYFSLLKRHYNCDPWNGSKGYLAEGGEVKAQGIALYQGIGATDLKVEECHAQPSYRGIPAKLAEYLQNLNYEVNQELVQQFERAAESPASREQPLRM